MQSLLEKLNTPAALAIVLVVIVLANGALFYQSRSSSGQPDEGSRQSSANVSQNDETALIEETTDVRESSPQREETAERGGTTAPEPSQEATEREAAQEETTDEETPPNDSENAENSENTSDENAPVEEEDSGGDRAPVEAEDSTLLAGLGSSVESCRESADDEECIRDFVFEVAPDSRYVGGRVDLAASDDEQNTEVIYFEDPRLAACEFERAEYEADGGRYSVILVGEGSFNDERGAQCIPQA